MEGKICFGVLFVSCSSFAYFNGKCVGRNSHNITCRLPALDYRGLYYYGLHGLW